jgi:hypothetical protein
MCESSGGDGQESDKVRSETIIGISWAKHNSINLAASFFGFLDFCLFLSISCFHSTLLILARRKGVPKNQNPAMINSRELPHWLSIW